MSYAFREFYCQLYFYSHHSILSDRLPTFQARCKQMIIARLVVRIRGPSQSTHECIFLKVFTVSTDLLHEYRNDMTFYFVQYVRSQICLSGIARMDIAARETAAAAPTAADASVAAPTAATASRAAAAAANEAASCSNRIPCAWLGAGPKQPGRARPSCNSQ